MMMGMEEDPEDHTAVASAIFISVAVYAVSLFSSEANSFELTISGIPSILRIPSLVTCASESKGGNITMKTVHEEKL